MKNGVSFGRVLALWTLLVVVVGIYLDHRVPIPVRLYVKSHPFQAVLLTHGLFISLYSLARIIRHEFLYHQGARLDARSRRLQSERLDFSHHIKDEL